MHKRHLVAKTEALSPTVHWWTRLFGRVGRKAFFKTPFTMKGWPCVSLLSDRDGSTRWGFLGSRQACSSFSATNQPTRIMLSQTCFTLLALYEGGVRSFLLHLDFSLDKDLKCHQFLPSVSARVDSCLRRRRSTPPYLPERELSLWSTPITVCSPVTRPSNEGAGARRGLSVRARFMKNLRLLQRPCCL